MTYSQSTWVVRVALRYPHPKTLNLSLDSHQNQQVVNCDTYVHFWRTHTHKKNARQNFTCYTRDVKINETQHIRWMISEPAFVFVPTNPANPTHQPPLTTTPSKRNVEKRDTESNTDKRRYIEKSNVKKIPATIFKLVGTRLRFWAQWGKYIRESKPLFWQHACTNPQNQRKLNQNSTRITNRQNRWSRYNCVLSQNESIDNQLWTHGTFVDCVLVCSCGHFDSMDLCGCQVVYVLSQKKNRLSAWWMHRFAGLVSI